MTPLQKLPKNKGDLGQLIVAKGFKNLPKVQLIAQSGHTAPNPQLGQRGAAVTMLLQCRRVLPLIVLTNRTACWQRLWLSLYSGRFRFQRPAVRIHSSEKLYSEHLLSTLLKRQDENKEKEAGNGPFKKPEQLD